MNIKSYVKLYELLASVPATREENRAFGLTHVMLKNKPTEQLLAWIEKHQHRLHKPLLSDTFSSYLYRVTFVIGLIAFVLGLLTGVALLSYNGDAPVNVVYFMAVTVFLPLFSMLLTFFAMLRARSAENVMIHLSPAFWMEKVMGVLPGRVQEQIQGLKINPMLANWIIIKRSQIIVLLFSLGLLLALLGVIVTKDIAFAWSTTLQLSPEEMYSFLQTVAFPWREFAPFAVPSLELIEQSQYFRLGTTLDQEMIAHASQLGEWWKFLAFSTLFYAIFLRFWLFIFASFGLNSAIKRSFFTLDGTTQLLREINEPIISTHADQSEKVFLSEGGNYGQVVNRLDASYDGIQGWAIPHDELLVLAESLKIIAPVHCQVGGTNRIEEDTEIVFKSHGEILLFVKAWEPPTMDFVDYLTELTGKVDKVIIVPIGTVENHYKASPKELDVWENKLSRLGDRKVWLKRSVNETQRMKVDNAES